MIQRCASLLLAVTVVMMGGVASAEVTSISFDGTKVRVNGLLVNDGSAASGLLMNARMIHAATEDYNVGTRPNWAYPGSVWSAQRNVNEFMAALPTYASYGLDMVTIGMQGGHPRYHCADDANLRQRNFSMFAPDGTLREDAKVRLGDAIRRADANNIIVTVQYFYRTVDKDLNGSAAILRAIDQATAFLKSLNTGNVLIEIANESSDNNFNDPVLQVAQLDERIAQIKKIWPAALVTTSMSGGAVYPADLARAVDWTSLHGGNRSPAKVTNKVKTLLQLGKPVAVTEANWNLQVMNSVISAGAGYGYFDQGCEITGDYVGAARYRDGYQSLPVNYGVNTDMKRAFFTRVRELTS